MWWMERDHANSKKEIGRTKQNEPHRRTCQCQNDEGGVCLSPRGHSTSTSPNVSADFQRSLSLPLSSRRCSLRSLSPSSIQIAPCCFLPPVPTNVFSSVFRLRRCLSPEVRVCARCERKKGRGGVGVWHVRACVWVYLSLLSSSALLFASYHLP